MSARIATAPSSATATPLAGSKSTAAATATAGSDPSQAAPAARGAPGGSNGAGADGGSNPDFLAALLQAAQTDAPATPSADRGNAGDATDGNDGEAASTDRLQSADGTRAATAASTDAAAASLSAPACTPSVATPVIGIDAADASSCDRGGARRCLRLHAASDTSSANPDAVTAAMLAMANALPGAVASLAARATTDGASTPTDSSTAVASADGSSGQATAGAAASSSAAADFATPPQRLGGAGIAGLIGADHEAPDQGADSRAAPPANAATPAGLSDLLRSLPAAANPVGLRDTTIAVPVGSDGWPRAVAAQLHWFVSNGVQSATLRLMPEHLGPIDVHVDVQQSQVNVNFNAAHADTRAALEQTVPRLRELLAGGGLTLGQANVQQQSQPRAQAPSSAARAALAAGQSTDPVAAAAPRLLGLLDEYA
jgi:flagellar hook-length control protein FliK